MFRTSYSINFRITLTPSYYGQTGHSVATYNFFKWRVVLKVVSGTLISIKYRMIRQSKIIDGILYDTLTSKFNLILIKSLAKNVTRINMFANHIICNVESTI